MAFTLASDSRAFLGVTALTFNVVQVYNIFKNNVYKEG